MQNTRILDELVAALVDLVGFLNSPQRDEVLLREAGVTLDRALFPLLVRLGMREALGVAELADQVGRDYTTVSRQLATLARRNLIDRTEGDFDRRRRAARLTDDGKRIVEAITRARRRLLSRALADWSATELQVLADCVRRFADALSAAAGVPPTLSNFSMAAARGAGPGVKRRKPRTAAAGTR